MRSADRWQITTAAVLAALAVLVLVLPYPPQVGDSGNYGYTPDPEGTAEFLSELDRPTFAEAGADAVKGARYVDTLLYRQLNAAHEARYGMPWQAWNQGNHGSCVSFAFALGAYVAQSVDWAEGDMEEPPLAVATEPIYGGSRTAARIPPITVNNGGDGSYGAAAARWIRGLANGTGGILYRREYPEHRIDLSEYSIPRSKEMGRLGVFENLAREAYKHRALSVAKVSTWDELAAAIESGYPVAICSTVGYGGNSRRDADGFLDRGSSWAHAMLIVGIRHAKNAEKKEGGVGVGAANPRDGALIANSWGEYWLDERSPRWPDDMPKGCFWASRKNVESALSQGDSFAIGGVEFRYRQLDHREWLQGDR